MTASCRSGLVDGGAMARSHKCSLVAYDLRHSCLLYRCWLFCNAPEIHWLTATQRHGRLRFGGDTRQTPHVPKGLDPGVQGLNFDMLRHHSRRTHGEIQIQPILHTPARACRDPVRITPLKWPLQFTRRLDLHIPPESVAALRPSSAAVKRNELDEAVTRVQHACTLG